MIEHTPTEVNCGRALRYTENSIRGDLKISKKGTLVHFIEFINFKVKNLINACIYQRPCVNPIEIIYIYISHKYFKKFQKKAKRLF